MKKLKLKGLLSLFAVIIIIMLSLTYIASAADSSATTETTNSEPTPAVIYGPTEPTTTAAVEEPTTTEQQPASEELTTEQPTSEEQTTTEEPTTEQPSVEEPTTGELPSGEPTGIAVEDIYSGWAYWDILMAQTVYGLGNEGTYSNYRGSFTWMKFTPVLGSIAAKFGIEIEWAKKDEYAYTRGETINDLYSIICTVLDIDESAQVPAIDYFVEHGLIKGRDGGEYQLDKTGTTEEMIVFSVRVYEYLVNELGLDAKGFFWKVTGEKNTVYLLGSIHISDGTLYPMNSEIESAFDSSGNLVEEIDFAGETEEESNYIYEKAFVPEGSTIKDYIAPEVYNAYAEICGMFGIPQSAYDSLQPWYAQMMLDQIATGISFTGGNTTDLNEIFASFSNVADFGVDNHFMNKALFQNKNIIGLESSKFQIDMLSSFSPELQEAMLVGSLLNIYDLLGYSDEESAPADEANGSGSGNSDAAIYAMLDMWKSGDEKALGEALGVDTVWKDPLNIEYTDKMITQRNIGMADKIMVFLNEGEEDYFVIVGAAHMLGENGIIAILLRAGYTVERIK